jgi:hypothetical protein
MLHTSTTNSHAGAMVAGNGFGLIVDETQTGGCEKIMDIGTSCKS